MTLPIQDEYAGLEISKQRKYQLRHPEREAERRRRYDESETGKESRRQRNARYREKQKRLSTGSDNKDA
jgi:hypothetical protein